MMNYEENKSVEITEENVEKDAAVIEAEKMFEMLGADESSLETAGESSPTPAGEEPDGSTELKYNVVEHEISNDLLLPNIHVGVEKTITNNDNIQFMVVVRHENGRKVGPYKAGEADRIPIDLANAGIILNEETELPILEQLIKTAVLRSNDTKNYPDFPIYKHSEIGWKTLANGTQVYLGNKAVGLNHTSQYTGKEVSCHGSLEDWVEAVNQLIAPKVVPSIVMASSVSGIIRQKIRSVCEDTQLVLGLIGDTSIGKTTLTRAAHSVFCNPMSVNDYNCTANAMQELLAKGGPKVNAVDDIMRMKEVKNTNPENLIDLIFQLVTGKGRTRCNTDGSTKEAKEYFGSVIVSANTSLLVKTIGHDVGQTRRLIELPVKKGDIADSSESIRIMARMFAENYGYAADKFAEGLLNMSEDEVIQIFSNYLVDYENMHHMQQLSKRYAMISLCADLCNRFIGTKYDLVAIMKYLKQMAEHIYNMFYGFAQVVIDPSTVSKDLADYFVKYSSYFQYEKYNKGDLANGMMGDPNNGVKGTLGTCVINKGELILRIPTIDTEEFYRDDNTPYILMGVNPDDILDEDGYNLPNCPEDFVEVMKDLRKLRVIKCGGDAQRLKKKAKIEKCGGQPYVVEFHIQLTHNPMIKNAIKNSRGYYEKVDHKDHVDHEI